MDSSEVIREMRQEIMRKGGELLSALGRQIHPNLVVLVHWDTNSAPIGTVEVATTTGTLIEPQRKRRLHDWPDGTTKKDRQRFYVSNYLLKKQGKTPLTVKEWSSSEKHK